MKIVKPFRGNGPNRRIPVDELADLFRSSQNGTASASLAVVTKPDGGERWFLEDGRVYVEVVTMPEGLPLTCRLGVCSSGPGAGLWFIPEAGAQVIVVLPSDAIDFMPTIVAVLDSQQAPDGVGDDKTILQSKTPMHHRAPTILLGPNADVVEITGEHTYAKSQSVQLGPRAGAMVPLQSGVVIASGVDTFTGVPYGILGSASTKVQADK